VTLAKDRRAIEQRAREEGGVEVAYKIPRGATWSQGLSTKPRAWTDFVLARPRRVWNWDSRLDHLRDRFQESTEADADRSALVDARAPEGRAARALATAAGQERAELAAVAAGLETRRDKADAARAAAREAACDAALARIFAQAAAGARASGRGGADAGADAGGEVAGQMDVREFFTMCRRIELLSSTSGPPRAERASKEQAVAAFRAVRADKRTGQAASGTSSLLFPGFLRAIRALAVEAQAPLAELLGVCDPIQRRLSVAERQSAETLAEERVMAARDERIQRERAAKRAAHVVQPHHLERPAQRRRLSCARASPPQRAPGPTPTPKRHARAALFALAHVF